MSDSESENDILTRKHKRTKLHPTQTTKMRLHQAVKTVTKKASKHRNRIKSKRKSRVDILLDDSDDSGCDIAVPAISIPASRSIASLIGSSRPVQGVARASSAVLSAAAPVASSFFSGLGRLSNSIFDAAARNAGGR